MDAPYTPAQVMPRGLADAVHDLPYWFVIGGQAVRCFAPYRPSRDVDFGVESPSDLDDLISRLRRRGKVEVQERTRDTVHLLWNGTNDQGSVVGTGIYFLRIRAGNWSEVKKVMLVK